MPELVEIWGHISKNNHQPGKASKGQHGVDRPGGIAGRRKGQQALLAKARPLEVSDGQVEEQKRRGTLIRTKP